MSYLGDFKASSSVNFNFSTHAASGASVAPSNAFEAADLIIYKGSSATQRTSASGITMTSPFDSIVGLHHVTIDLSDNTDAGFWAAGSDYFVILSPDTETVDSLTVVKQVASFSIENRVVNWAQVVSPTTTLNLSGTTVKTATDVEAIVGSGTHGNAALKTLIDAVDNFIDTEVAAIITTLGTPAGASVSADIAAIEAQTDDIGAAGAGLSAIPWNAAWDAEVQSEVQDAIEANHLDHLLAVTYDPASKPGAADALLNELVESDGGVARYTANALEQGPGGASSNPFQLATGTIGSTGNTTTTLHLDGLTQGDDELNDVLIVVRDVSTDEYHSRWILDWVLSTELATVAALPFTPQDATDTYTLLGVRQDVTGGSGLDAAGVRAAIGMASANLDTQLSTIDTVVDSILVDTAEIGAAGAGLTNINLPNQTMDIVGNITGNLSGSVGSVTADVTLADGVTHGGSTAVLQLKNVAISNSSGDAVAIASTGSNGHGMYVTAHGTGDGIHTIGGATGAGMRMQGGATSGAGFAATATTLGNGIIAVGAGGQEDILADISGSISSIATGGITAASFAANAITATVIATNAIGAAQIAPDAIGASELAADAVTEIQSGLATAAALTTIDDFLDTEIAAILADTNELQTDWANGGRLDLILDIIAADTTTDIPALIDALPTAAENAAALMDLSNGIETSITPRQAIRLILAAAAGKLSGAATTTISIRDTTDAKNRIVATVDSDGNRSAVTLDAT